MAPDTDPEGIDPIDPDAPRPDPNGPGSHRRKRRRRRRVRPEDRPVRSGPIPEDQEPMSLPDAGLAHMAGGPSDAPDDAAGAGEEATEEARTGGTDASSSGWVRPPLSADPSDDQPGRSGPIVEDVEPMSTPDAALVSLAGGVPRGDEEPSTPPTDSARVAWMVFGTLLFVVVVAVAVWFFFGGSGDEAAAPPTSSTTSLGRSDAGDAAVGETPPDSGDATAAFAGSPAAERTSAAVAGYASDPDVALGCIGDGLRARNTSQSELDAMANPDISTWPPGLAEAKAEILEDCVDLEQYYLEWFGSFDFQDATCVRIMTDHVLANWSWLRFLEDGILDPVLRPLLDAEFAAFVTAGYGEKGCFAASG